MLPFKIDAGGSYIMRRVPRTMHVNRLKLYKGGKETHPPLIVCACGGEWLRLKQWATCMSLRTM